MLSLKDEYTFHFLNFQIVVLCNLSANCWFCVILLLTAPPEDFIKKFIAHCNILATSNALSRNTLSEAVLLGNSLKSP